jgi:hypothetical protein
MLRCSYLNLSFIFIAFYLKQLNWCVHTFMKATDGIVIISLEIKNEIIIYQNKNKRRIDKQLETKLTYFKSYECPTFLLIFFRKGIYIYIYKYLCVYLFI